MKSKGSFSGEPPAARTGAVDAFILFNEAEPDVERINDMLVERGITTYFWRRDIQPGEGWEGVEAAQLRSARTILVFLGPAGWGPTHTRLAEQAQRLAKRIIPVLVGDPPQGQMDRAGSLFRKIRYIAIINGDPDAIDRLVEAIRQRETVQPTLIDQLVGLLVGGNDDQRSDVLARIGLLGPADRTALGGRLRDEITRRFGVGAEGAVPTPVRDPQLIPSIRSWLCNALIRAQPEDAESRNVLLAQFDKPVLSNRAVRYWVLAGLYRAKATYLTEALERARSAPEVEVQQLARAIASPDDPGLSGEFISRLGADYDTAWPVLRVLRIVPMPAVTPAVCARLARAEPGSDDAYDCLHALAHPATAAQAAELLSDQPGVPAVVERVVAASQGAIANTVLGFALFLTPFDRTRVRRALADGVAAAPQTRPVIDRLRRGLEHPDPGDASGVRTIAGYASDEIDVRDDRLGILEDVRTLTSVMLAKDVKPPLAIGLFGDWGSGKSYFIQSMKAAAAEIAAAAGTAANSPYCPNVVQIEFNAWHFVDTNLWASLVSHILDQLAAHVAPEATPEEREAALLSELGSAKTEVSATEAEKNRAAKTVAELEQDLQRLRAERERKQIELRDLEAADLQRLVEDDKDLQKNLTEALDKLGLSAVLVGAEDLSRVVAETSTLRGQVAALALGLVRGWGWVLAAALLVVGGILLLPALTSWASSHLGLDEVAARVGGLLSQAAVVLAGGLAVLRKGIDRVQQGLGILRQVKQQVDRMVAEKRTQPTPEEDHLRAAIASSHAQEREAATKMSAAEARVTELEQRVLALREGRTLARFLAERSRSEDYRKHLGLISTIRADFDSLGDRLKQAPVPGSPYRPVDRIVLYIDDLDRCPVGKVMDVLQAVHLLLAYKLFVVVVGVDPRWLIHSLGATYRAFDGAGTRTGDDPELWRTTPQNYLEKIFQIPYCLRPMTSAGFGRLIGGLLLPTPEEDLPGAGRTADAPVGSAAGEGSRPTPRTPPPADVPLVEPGSASGTGASEPVAPPDREAAVTEEALVIRAWEAAFAELLFKLIPTPRAAKRFSNIYRILKASVRRADLARFEGTAGIPGEFQVPMLLLGVVIGSPADGAVVFPRLGNAASAGSSVTGVLQQVSTLDPESASLRELEPFFRQIVSEVAFPTDPGVFQHWIPRVARFSFVINRLMHAADRELEAIRGHAG